MPDENGTGIEESDDIWERRRGPYQRPCVKWMDFAAWASFPGDSMVVYRVQRSMPIALCGRNELGPTPEEVHLGHRRTRDPLD